jgi:hypothetical protein
MKKIINSSFQILSFVSVGLFVMCCSVSGQDTPKVFPALPDSINQIVTRSCMPCHSNDGGLMSRTKLNFSVWAKYSADKQAERAKKMYSELSESKMPPKKAREDRPNLIPTSQQVDIIKRWSDSFAVQGK